ncbi:hypothetical protein [Clostridium pasteurianum]|uniref:Uncharacterized protein n=1 Tax=Clostridium pasteurianum BC1 TaxID=86416 RepID=R4K2N9_CLOPA|nr:hypothetical protein [Clostridium pasteurianum]AGK97372.1 hypothetical protein Clopa_2511 [Clostridium pasteurianum BC1]
MPIKVEIPTHKDALIKQIKALEYKIEHDTNKRAREIHQDAYNALMEEYLNEE